jgi:hypothetical protein
MSKSIFIALLGILLFTGVIPLFGKTASAQTSVSFQVFYDQLSPYGDWVDYPSYGYVWVPAGREGFRPYGTRGHWIYTEDGWTWVSDYSWGWATFHYGNWFYDDSYGWMWAPGYEWAPAWVTWGEYGGNYCWAPVGPHVNIGVSFASYRPPYNYWNFCPRDRITNVNLSRYYVNSHQNTTVINHITVINNVRTGGGGAYHRGPAPANVERFTHSPIRPVAIHASSRPGAASVQNGQLAIYRPTVRNFNAGIRPSKLRDLHALRPINNSRPANQPSANRTQPGANRTLPGANGNQPAHNNPLRPAGAASPRATMPAHQPPAHTEQPRQNPLQPARPSPLVPPHQATPQPSHQPRPNPTQPARPSPQHPLHQAPNNNTPHPAPQQPVHQQPRPAPQQPFKEAPQHTSPRPLRPQQQPRPVQPQQQPHAIQPHQQPVRQAPAPQPLNRPAVQPRPAGPPPGNPNPPHEHHR